MKSILHHFLQGMVQPFKVFPKILFLISSSTTISSHIGYCSITTAFVLWIVWISSYFKSTSNPAMLILWALLALAINSNSHEKIGKRSFQLLISSPTQPTPSIALVVKQLYRSIFLACFIIPLLSLTVVFPWISPFGNFLLILFLPSFLIFELKSYNKGWEFKSHIGNF